MTLTPDDTRGPTGIRESGEERYRLFFECNPQPMWVYDVETLAFLEVNHAAIQHYGYSRDEFLDMTIADIRPPEDVPRLRANVAGVRERVHDRAGQWRHLRKDGSLIDVEIVSHVLQYEGRLAELVVATDITERLRTEREITERLEYERTVARLASQISAHATLDETACSALAELGAMSGADRTYIFQFSSDGTFMDNTHEWCAEGVRPEVARLQGLRTDAFPWIVRMLAAGECVDCPDVAALPPEAAHEREILEAQDVRSMFILPLHARGALAGFAGLDNTRTTHGIPEHAKQALHVAVNLFSAALEHERTVNQRRHAAARLEGFLAHSPLLFTEFDLDGVYRLANPAAAAVLGKSPGEVTGRRVEELLPQAVAKRFRERLRTVAETRAPLHVQDALPSASGTRHYQTVLFPMLDPAGNPLSIGAVGQDVTEQRIEETRLRLQGAALEAAANTIIITNRAGEIEWANPAFTAASGYAIEEAIGKNPRDLVKSGVHAKEFYRHMWDTILSGQVWRGEMTNRRKDGSLFHEAATITPVRDHTGAITHFIGVKEDVTEKKRIEAQFLQAQKMESIGRLAGGVAHDFNNMLGIILGHAEIALGGIEDGDPLAAGLREIQQAAQRSAQLTRQLLAFARQQAATPQLIDLNASIGQMLRMLQRLIGENIALNWVPCDGTAAVLMDPAQVDQILANLVLNARDAITGSGGIDIVTRRFAIEAGQGRRPGGLPPGNYVELSVADTGCGMDSETIEKIFEPFFTTKAVGQGTGLGLPTVFGIVKQNLGHIEVESAPGKGTLFRIHLPLRAPGAGPCAPPAESGARVPEGAETILLVEDDAALLRLQKRMLEPLGYTVLAANGPREALDFVQDHPGEIHLVLTDVVMPEMSGHELRQRIQQRRPGMRALFMSGYTADIIAQHGVIDEGIQFIEKPFTRAELAAKVRQALAVS